MKSSQWAGLIAGVVGAMGGVFIGATAGVPAGASVIEAWNALMFPEFIIGAVVAGAAAVTAFLTKSSRQ